MAFWGTQVKPGKPFTHLPDNAKGRLHISQATLGTGTAETKSVVQCNVGNRSPVFLCSLFPRQSESCQLNLEFDEADEVIFSVIGRLSVHLTGYYLRGSRRYNQDDGSESYGEDIADTETERSAADDSEYEDSFIDDSDPELIPHSPISSGEVAEETLHERKPKNEKARYRRLRKRYQPCQSDDDCTSQQNIFANGGTCMPALDSENEDIIAISSLYKSAARTRPEAEEKTKDETKLTISKEVKVDGNCTTLAEPKADVFIDTDLKRQSDEHEPMLYSAQVGSENRLKPKKRKMQSKEEEHIRTGIEDEFFFGTVLKWDNAKQCETKAEQSNQDMTVINEDDKRGGNLLHISPPSVELVHGTIAKSRKKKKKQAKEEKGLEDESNFHGNVNREGKAQQDEANGENIGEDILLKNEENQNKANEEKAVLPWNSQLPSPQLSPENGLKPKRKRRKGAEDKTLEANSGDHTNVIKEDKSNQDELKSDGTKCNGYVQYEPNQRHTSHVIFDNIDDQSANEKHSRKKRKKKKNKTSKGGQISA